MLFGSLSLKQQQQPCRSHLSSSGPRASRLAAARGMAPPRPRLQRLTRNALSSNKRTLKGLLAYMTAANVRILACSPSLPPPARARSEARLQAPAGSSAEGRDATPAVWRRAVDAETLRVYRQDRGMQEGDAAIRAGNL